MTRTHLTDYYSRRASEYERIYHKPERQDDLAALRQIVGDLLAGHEVLELACGTGYWTEVIAATARSVLATDATPAVLEIAKRKPYPTGRVRIREADAFAPGSIPGRFTAAFAGFWWSHLLRGQISEFVGSLHDRLGPGTRVIFIDNRWVEGSSTPECRTDDEGNTYQLRVLEDGSEHEVVKNFPAEADLRAALCGLASGIEITQLTYYWCLSYTVGSEPIQS